MNNKEVALSHKRHTLAHLLASAVLEAYPEAKNTIGPAIENGFYYDFDFGATAPGDAELKELQKRMKKLLNKWDTFSHEEVSATEAKERFAGNPYKLELIDEIMAKGETITLYTCGGFTDLCRGGHCEHPNKDIDTDAFKLSRIAGAYWRGDERNKMLTRIYGLAFETKDELAAYEKQQEEAEKRDHRKLGKELDLFMISEEVGKGLPLWLPNGAFIRHQLEDYMYKKEFQYDYKYVYTPILTHKKLYETSGHLAHYREDMYNPITIEDEEYYLRPMNCPHHHMIFKHKPLSYKKLPLRLAEFGLVHRFERSGVLTGLIRARGFTQNDSHIYCQKSDLKKELLSVLTLFKEVYRDFKIDGYWFRLSLPDFSNTEKYGDIQDKDMWDEASSIARQALEEFGVPYVEGSGEASFYGPKIDVQIKNVHGKEDTIATAQVDFYSSKRFDLYFTNDKGAEEHPVIIHRAILGSFDRFFAFLTEHTAGNFPLWLSPVQVAVIPVRDTHNEKAKEIFNTLFGHGMRAELHDEDENLGKKVRAAKNMKVPYTIIIGDNDIEAGKVTLESRDTGSLGQLTVEEVLEKLSVEIKERK